MFIAGETMPLPGTKEHGIRTESSFCYVPHREDTTDMSEQTITLKSVNDLRLTPLR